ncbi:MAG: potassium channel family protein [Steroidobacteraceae bacterium]
MKRGPSRRRILFTKSPLNPEATLLLRFVLIFALFALTFTVFWWDRAGLADHHDGVVSFTDVIYFTMVTITTVGYGDIVPVTDRARLIDAIFVTPIRIFVWFIFLGTAYQLVIQKVIEDFRMTMLQRRLTRHVIILGFGGRGSTAAQELVAQGVPAGEIVIIDHEQSRIEQAAEQGFVALHGEAAREELLRVAGAERARAAVLALDRDDTTVLAVLTLRSLNSTMRIVATVHEDENIKLVRGSGADMTLSAARLGGFLLADSLAGKHTVDLLGDMMSRGGSVALFERDALPQDIDRSVRELGDELVIKLIRDGKSYPFWHAPQLRIKAGDRLVGIRRDSDAQRLDVLNES